MDREHVVSFLLEWASSQDLLQDPALVDSYVDSRPVPCLTSAGLFQATHVEPADIVIFVIDTEGFDTQFVPSFLSLADFRPSVLQFEHVRQQLDDLVTCWIVKELALRGYIVFRHGHDIVAVLLD